MKIPLSSKLIELLSTLGIISGTSKEPKQLGVLKTVLKLSKSPPVPITLTEIYDKMKENIDVSKAWIRRILNSLVDIKLIEVESPSAYRKKYYTDVNTIMGGLEDLKSQAIENTKEQIDKLKIDLETIDNLQCAVLAQDIVKELTGKGQIVTSRIIKGTQELDRVVRYNIFDIAKKDDIIRSTIGWIEPFLGHDAPQRLDKYFDAVMRGVEIRGSVTQDFVKSTQIEGGISKESLTKLLKSIIQVREKGAKFGARIFSGSPDYTFIALNNKCMVLAVSENPLHATWVTRAFNPDLIDNAVLSFDEQWKKSISLLDLKPQEMMIMGAQSDSLILQALEDASSDEKSN